jgi:hypothetical protein
MSVSMVEVSGQASQSASALVIYLDENMAR